MLSLAKLGGGIQFGGGRLLRPLPLGYPPLRGSSYNSNFNGVADFDWLDYRKQLWLPWLQLRARFITTDGEFNATGTCGRINIIKI